jgi:hypothetical protein
MNIYCLILMREIFTTNYLVEFPKPDILCHNAHRIMDIPRVYYTEKHDMTYFYPSEYLSHHLY